MIARVNHAHRFGRNDQQFEIEFYPSIRPGTYGFVSIGVAPDHTLYPKRRLAVDLYQSVGARVRGVGWLPKAGVHRRDVDLCRHGHEVRRQLDADREGLSRAGARLARLDVRPCVVRRYFGSDGSSYVGAGYSQGLSREEIRGIGDLVALDSQTVRGQMDTVITARLRLQVEASTSRQERTERPLAVADVALDRLFGEVLMESPVARFAASLAMLALFYWALLAPPMSKASAASVIGDAEVDAALVASREAFSAGQFEQALAPTEQLVARFPTQHVYLERLAFIYHALGRYRDEATAWHRFMERSPTPWDACPAVAAAHAADRDPAGAMAAYETCWETTPWNPEAAFFLAREHERNGDAERATALYRRAIEIDAAHADSQLGLARLSLHASRFDEASANALAVVEQFPDHADAHLILAQAAQRTGDEARARQHFQETLRIEERYFDAHVGLGILEFTEQRASAARQHFERALSLDPSRRAEVTAWLDRTEATR